MKRKGEFICGLDFIVFEYNTMVIDSSSCQLKRSQSVLGDTSRILLKVLFESICIEHGRWLTQSLLQLQVCLLLNSLCVLKSLDELHLQLFHLGDFVHLHISQRLLLLASMSVLSLGGYLLASPLFFDLHLGESL